MRDAVDRLVLGLVPAPGLSAPDPRKRTFARELERATSVYVVQRTVGSYDELEREMTLARVDVAWLPPVLFSRLERDAVVVALATRATTHSIFATLVTAADSKTTDLAHVHGARVAWVDPLSASGYVVARLGLAAAGLDPRATFRSEFFAGSHPEAIRAVLDGRADVAATFTHVDAAGGVVRGPWDEMGVDRERLRVVALLGETPPDVVAARSSVPEEIRAALTRALVGAAHDDALGATIEGVFGVRRFVEGKTGSYAALRDLMERASDAGLAGVTDAFTSTAPPGARGNG